MRRRLFLRSSTFSAPGRAGQRHLDLPARVAQAARVERSVPDRERARGGRVNDQFTLAFLRSPAGTTPYVDLGAACAAPIEIVGGVRATPVLERGFIKALNVAFSVRTQLAGNYTAAFKLRGSRGEDLGLFTQTVPSTANGTIEFAQNIPATTFLTADGPYEVTSLLVSGPASAQFSTIGSTGSFLRWQFFPRVKGDLDGDGDVDAADRQIQSAFRNTVSLTPGDRRDLNGDRRIDVLDLRVIPTLACAVGACPPF